MATFPRRFRSVVVNKIESHGVICARAIRSRVDLPLVREPPGKGFRKLGFDTLLFRHPAPLPGATERRRIPARRVVQLEMRSDFADGGLTRARQLDEGDCPPMIHG